MHYRDDVNLSGQNSVDDSERKALAQPLPRSPARQDSRVRICLNAFEKTLNFGAELQPNLFGLQGVKSYRLLKFPFGASIKNDLPHRRSEARTRLNTSAAGIPTSLPVSKSSMRRSTSSIHAASISGSSSSGFTGRVSNSFRARRSRSRFGSLTAASSICFAVIARSFTASLARPFT
jgi:hypothetical protein